MSQWARAPPPASLGGLGTATRSLASLRAMACAGLLAVCLLRPPAPQPPRHPAPAAGHALFQDVSRAPVGGCRAPQVSVLRVSVSPSTSVWFCLLRSLSQIICDPAILIPRLCVPLIVCLPLRSVSLLVSTIVLLSSTPNVPSGARGCQHSVTADITDLLHCSPCWADGPWEPLDLEGALSCPRSLRPDPEGGRVLQLVRDSSHGQQVAALKPPCVATEHPDPTQPPL